VNNKFTKIVSLAILIFFGCSQPKSTSTVVIWVSGGLHENWLPVGDYGKAKFGGLLRVSRALELYRNSGDLLVDLGRFRYPEGVAGEMRASRIHGNGILKQMARMKYTALNVSRFDCSPLKGELAARSYELSLPLISSNVSPPDSLFLPIKTIHLPGGSLVWIHALSGGSNEFPARKRNSISVPSTIPHPTLDILLTDASISEITAFCMNNPDIGLILWLNDGDPTVNEVAGKLVLGLGNRGYNLGRIELNISNTWRPTLQTRDLSAWVDGKSFRHHPVREWVLSRLMFWKKKVALKASLWAVPEAISPQNEAEQQYLQIQEENQRLSDLVEVHKEAPQEFVGPQRCLECHKSPHPDDLARLHQSNNTEAIDSYPIYERCLPCHTTGFDDPSGFLFPGERPELQWVSCEACHDAAFHHSIRGEKPYPPIPDKKFCDKCHTPNQLPLDHPKKILEPESAEIP